MFIYTSVDAQNNIDTLQLKLSTYIDKNGFDTVAFNIAENLFLATIDISPSTAAEYGAICQQIALKLSDSLLIARSQNLRGISFMKQKTYFMATEAFFTAYKTYIKFDNKTDIAFTLLNIGSSYLEQNLEGIGESKIIEALKIYRKIGDSVGVADAYALLGKAYIKINNNTAIEYLKKAEKIFNTFDVQAKLANTYNLIAISYLNLGQNELAVNYLMEALNIFVDNKIELKQADSYLIIGDAFYNDTLFYKAKYYYELAENIYLDKSSIEQVADAKYKIASVYYELGNFKEAISIAYEALRYAELNNNYQLKSYSYLIISDSYQDENEIDSAFKYSKIYQETLIEYYEVKNSRNFSAFQMNLETQSNKQEIEFLKIKNEKDKLQNIQKQHNRNLAFILIIGLLVFLYLIFMFFRTRERKKSAKHLEKSNSLLQIEIEERKKTEIEAQSKEEQYKLLFRKTPIGIIQFNENLLITDANERFLEIFHRSNKEVLNQHLNRVFDRITVLKISKLFGSNDEVIKTTTEIPTKKEVIYVSITVKKYTFWTKDTEFTGGVIILEDFTEHKKAERFYKKNIVSKQRLVKQLPDDLILLDKNNNILEIHFPDAPEREIGVLKLEDVFSERHASVFNSHMVIANKSQKNTQFFFSDGSNNFLVRIIPTEETNLVIISHFEAEAQDAGIIVKSSNNSPKTSKEKYLKNLQDGIEQELLPVYQNIQRGLSFIMIKNFAEKVVKLGKTYNNSKIIEFGETLFDYVTSFNVVKVNNQLEKFPNLVSEFMGINTKLL